MWWPVVMLHSCMSFLFLLRRSRTQPKAFVTKKLNRGRGHFTFGCSLTLFRHCRDQNDGIKSFRHSDCSFTHPALIRPRQKQPIKSLGSFLLLSFIRMCILPCCSTYAKRSTSNCRMHIHAYIKRIHLKHKRTPLEKSMNQSINK